MTCLSLLVCNTGYLTLTLSRTLEEALLANRIVYLGSVFLPFFLLITIMKICRIRYPRRLPFVPSIVNAAMLLITVGGGYAQIYYATVSFEIVKGAGKLIKEYGPLHASYYIYLATYFGAILGVIICSFFKRKIVFYQHAFYRRFFHNRLFDKPDGFAGIPFLTNPIPRRQGGQT